MLRGVFYVVPTNLHLILKKKLESSPQIYIILRLETTKAIEQFALYSYSHSVLAIPYYVYIQNVSNQISVSVSVFVIFASDLPFGKNKKYTCPPFKCTCPDITTIGSIVKLSIVNSDT